MLAYALRRLLFFIPTILVVSLITFGLSNMVSGDPVTLVMGEEVVADEKNYEEFVLWMEEYRRAASQNHMDIPKFYFSILPSNYPDTLHRVLPISTQKYVKSLINRYGDWSLINRFVIGVEQLHSSLVLIDEKPNNYTEINSFVNQLGRTTNEYEIQKILDHLKRNESIYPQALSNIREVDRLFAEMKVSRRAGIFLPKVVWYGAENQYHYWLAGLLKGDLGSSIVDKKDVGSKIMNALPKTLLLNFIALIIALFLGFILGTYLATHLDSWMSRILLSKIYGVLAIPSFWLASLLVIFLTTSDYGAWTNIFPSEGFGHIPTGASFFQRISIRSSHLVLPVLSIALPLAGIIALQLRRSLVAEMKKTYIKTALLKGLSNRNVVWKHGVKNSIFPILTMFGSILPGMIGGSVAIELIFNIPGMGQLLLHSILSKDWSVVFGILMLTAVLTILSLLLMDILYVKLNPKVSLNSRRANG